MTSVIPIIRPISMCTEMYQNTDLAHEKQTLTWLIKAGHLMLLEYLPDIVGKDMLDQLHNFAYDVGWLCITANQCMKNKLCIASSKNAASKNNAAMQLSTYSMQDGMHICWLPAALDKYSRKDTSSTTVSSRSNDAKHNRYAIATQCNAMLCCFQAVVCIHTCCQICRSRCQSSLLDACAH